MKKIIAILLCLCMAFSLVACGGGGETPANNDGGQTNAGQQNDSGNNDASSNDSGKNEQTDSSNKDSVSLGERTLNKSGAVAAVNKLANTYYKLTTEKNLKVGYLGGSVTGGTGGTDGYCWASETTKWLKSKFPSANVTEKNIAWGGTSSFWGYFRMDEDNTGRDNLVAFNPDLVFVEFTFNDASAKLSKLQTTYYMEGIVKKLRKANPKVDIIFVFITSKGSMGKDTPNIIANKELAAHYGIPTINVGEALANEINSTGKDWDYYAGDIVHPNNNGYKVYADCIASYLNGALVASPDKSGIKDSDMPANDLCVNLMTESEIIPASQITDYTGFKAMKGNSANCPSMGGSRLFGKQGDKLTVEFEGKGIGFLADGGNGGKVKITVGDVSAVVDVMGGNNFEYVGVENLKSGKYTAQVEIVAGSKVAIGAFVVEK